MSINQQKTPQRVELKLFVGSIPKNWDEKQVLSFLSQYGQILDVTIITKKTDQKGSAFVRFASMTEAEKTIQLIQDKSNQMGGIVVKWADGERERLGLTGIPDDQPPRIYVNNLPKDCDQSDIRGLFEQYGQITDCQVIYEGALSQSAYITYTTKESCILALRLNNQPIMAGQPMTVRFATGNVPTAAPKTQRQDQDFNSLNNQEDMNDPVKEYMKSYTRWLDQKKKPYYVHWETGEIRKQVPPLGSIIYSPDGTKEIITREKYLNDLAAFNSKKTGPSGANLFVFHLPNDHKDSDLMELFQPYGNVISARVMTEPKSGKSKGFGFVSFDRPESAAKAKEAMDGFLIEKKKLSVTFKQNDGSSHPLHYQSLATIKLVQFDVYDW